MKLCKQPRIAFLAIVIAIVSAISSNHPADTTIADAPAKSLVSSHR